MKFRTKSIEVEAVRCKELIELAGTHWAQLPPWFVKVYEEGGDNRGMVICDDHIMLPTLEGVKYCHYSDWVICGPYGNLYSCPASLFNAGYERIVEDEK